MGEKTVEVIDDLDIIALYRFPEWRRLNRLLAGYIQEIGCRVMFYIHSPD